MTKLLSNEEAKLAWANGEQLQVAHITASDWDELNDKYSLGVFTSDMYVFRIKPRTVMINGIEVPAPFEPKNNESVWVVDSAMPLGYRNIFHHGCNVHFMCWRTEDEIKQVVAVFRQVLGEKP